VRANDASRRSDEPEDRAERCRDPEEGQACELDLTTEDKLTNEEETSVQVLRGDDLAIELDGLGDCV